MRLHIIQIFAGDQLLGGLDKVVVGREQRLGPVILVDLRLGCLDLVIEIGQLPISRTRSCEMALADTVGSAVETVYRRGDMFQKRRALAEAWAAYCAGGAEVGEFPAEVRSG